MRQFLSRLLARFVHPKPRYTRTHHQFISDRTPTDSEIADARRVLIKRGHIPPDYFAQKVARGKAIHDEITACAVGGKPCSVCVREGVCIAALEFPEEVNNSYNSPMDYEIERLSDRVAKLSVHSAPNDVLFYESFSEARHRPVMELVDAILLYGDWVYAEFKSGYLYMATGLDGGPDAHIRVRFSLGPLTFKEMVDIGNGQ